jgi:hypothetical protein
MWGEKQKIALSRTQAEIFNFSIHEKPENNIVKLLGSDSFIGFIDLKNVGENQKVPVLWSQAEISFF